MMTTRFVRKVFEVDAVRATIENLQDIADWCEGTMVEEGPGKWYVQVPVEPVINERQKRAYPGDWVLSGTAGFKVYQDRAFKRSFKRKKT